jgi:hypothetical protein
MIIKSIKSAVFRRISGLGVIEIPLSDTHFPLCVYSASIKHDLMSLGEKELEQVILILEHEKEAMLKEHNFPPLFDEMLSDLIKVQIERYGEKIG